MRTHFEAGNTSPCALSKESTSRIEGYNSEPSAKSYRSRKDRMSLLARVRASPKDSMALIEQDNNSTLLFFLFCEEFFACGFVEKWVTKFFTFCNEGLGYNTRQVTDASDIASTFCNRNSTTSIKQVKSV